MPRTSVPSKVLGYMAAGRAVIASVDPGSDTAAEIEAAGCGITAPPGDAATLAEAVCRAADDAAWREAAGTCARARFEAAYARDRVLERYGELLGHLAHRKQ